MRVNKEVRTFVASCCCRNAGT